VLSRGYGRAGGSHHLRVCLAQGATARPEHCGDEPALLARRHPQVPLYVGADRAESARLACLWDDPGVFVMDDGYQHLRLARALNLLLVDAERGLGNRRLLPRGPLREPPSALARADAVVISKANLGDAEALHQWLAGPGGVKSPIFRCDYVPRRLARLDGGAERPAASLAGEKVSLHCAIAQPEGFRATVETLGATVLLMMALPDHFPHGAERLADAEKLQAAQGLAPLWVTTEKDAVKLRGRVAQPERVWVLEMAVVPEPAAETFFFDSLRRLAIQ